MYKSVVCPGEGNVTAGTLDPSAPPPEVEPEVVK
jgi:hypothetical protein